MATWQQWCTSFLAESSCLERKMPSLRNRQILDRRRARHRWALPSSMTSLPVTGDFGRRGSATWSSCGRRSMPAWAVLAERGESATGPHLATCQQLQTLSGRTFVTATLWRHLQNHVTTRPSLLILKTGQKQRLLSQVRVAWVAAGPIFVLCLPTQYPCYPQKMSQLTILHGTESSIVRSFDPMWSICLFLFCIFIYFWFIESSYFFRLCNILVFIFVRERTKNFCSLVCDCIVLYVLRHWFTCARVTHLIVIRRSISIVSWNSLSADFLDSACIITARCTIVHIAVLPSHVVRLSVCPCVTWVDQVHMDCKSWKLSTRAISPTPSLFVTQRPPTYSQGNMGKFGAD